MAKKHGECEDCREEAHADLLARDVSDEELRAIERVPGRFRILTNRFQCDRHYEHFLHPESEDATLDEALEDSEGFW